MKKALFFLGLCLAFSPLLCLAQPGLSEMQSVKDDLTSSFFGAVDCSLILSAIFGLLGAVRIYHNWQMGKERITADVAAWFYAALFVILMGAFLQAIFGI
ncbi:DUF4134 family protein [Mucilaginibacter pineti]|uniref:DUF4134 family protein n=1 Tax=Mucilaginibacter pineti TaxID=1391627 RepID=UPI000B8372DD|nr:DUF4134 family protein [Mucilaginibacter pineti]